MSKQTAVEWLVEQISEKQPNGLYVIDTLEDVKRVFEQAKAMEREQVEDAYGDGLNAHRVDFCNRKEYYERNYGKEASHEG